jgi:hypothetical protein
MRHNTMLDQYQWEWSLPNQPSAFDRFAGKYDVKLAILANWARAMQGFIDGHEVSVSKRSKKRIRRFYLACAGIADFAKLNDREGSLGAIRAAYLRVRGILRSAA